MNTGANEKINNNGNEPQFQTQIVSVNDLLGGDINIGNNLINTSPSQDPPAQDPPSQDPPSQDPPSQDPPSQDPPSQDPQEEYDDQKIINYFKSKKGKDITSIDDLFKEAEVKTINPYESISDKAKSFLDYHKETGRDLEDYLELQKDISAISDIDLARERVRLENGSKWTNEEIDSYLERTLGVDLSDLEGMDAADKIALSGFSKLLRESKLSEQEKYKQPLENRNPPAQEQNQIADDEVLLENGERMKKVVYDKLLKDRQDYLHGLKTSSDNIKEALFVVKVDNKGSEQTLNFSYDYSSEDKHNMLSSAEDLQKTIKEKFGNDKGFNHGELQEAMFWIDKTNREKAISALIHKAIAGNTEQIMKEINNVNLGANPLQQLTPQSKEGVKIVSARELLM